MSTAANAAKQNFLISCKRLMLFLTDVFVDGLGGFTAGAHGQDDRRGSGYGIAAGEDPFTGSRTL